MVPTLIDIQNALGQHLAAMPDLPPIAWWDTAFDPKGAAHITVRNDQNGAIDDTVDGTALRQIGLLIINVVYPADNFANNATLLLQRISEHFAYGTRLTAGGGKVLINQPPRVSGGFSDRETWWSQAIVIPYLTES